MIRKKGSVDPKDWVTHTGARGLGGLDGQALHLSHESPPAVLQVAVEVDFNRAPWLPDEWGQGVKATKPNSRSKPNGGGGSLAAGSSLHGLPPKCPMRDPRHFDMLRGSRHGFVLPQGESGGVCGALSWLSLTVWFALSSVHQVGRKLSSKDGFNGQVRLARLQAGFAEANVGAFSVAKGDPGPVRGRRQSPNKFGPPSPEELRWPSQ